jgi:hypothetical protein
VIARVSTWARFDTIEISEMLLMHAMNAMNAMLVMNVVPLMHDCNKNQKPKKFDCSVMK